MVAKTMCCSHRLQCKTVLPTYDRHDCRTRKNTANSFARYSDMRNGNVLNLTCDRGINEGQSHTTLAVLIFDTENRDPPHPAWLKRPPPPLFVGLNLACPPSLFIAPCPGPLGQKKCSLLFLRNTNVTSFCEGKRTRMRWLCLKTSEVLA